MTDYPDHIMVMATTTVADVEFEDEKHWLATVERVARAISEAVKAEQARVKALEEALRPFAEAEEHTCERVPDNNGNVMLTALGLNIGHIRRARAALEGK